MTALGSKQSRSLSEKTAAEKQKKRSSGVELLLYIYNVGGLFLVGHDVEDEFVGLEHAVAADEGHVADGVVNGLGDDAFD